MQDQGSSLVLSSAAKPRLRWTPELHQRFVDAVNRVGGLEQASPKSLMRVMGIPGITLFHLKSHLQKYRLGKNLPSETCSDSSNQEDYNDNPGELDLCREESNKPLLVPIKESLKFGRAIQVHMEVQRKLHEQIEVQRHLQLRIEAQGKYLQKVLKKAQETLGGSSVGVENAKAELSQLVSIVDSGCLSSPLSELTQIRAVNLEELDRQIKVPGCSLESSLTSSETSVLNDNKEPKTGEVECVHKSRLTPVALLPLLDQPSKSKRGSISQGSCGEWITSKRFRADEEATTPGLSRFRDFETIDLNSQYKGDQDLDHTPIDLNSTETDQFNGVSLAL